MKRIQTLLIGGLASITSALLYVGNGESTEMVWTYQQCVEWRTYTCPPLRALSNASAMCGLRNTRVCTMYAPRLDSWVSWWLGASAATAIIFIGLLPIGRRS